MSRLESAIRRLEAQRLCLDLAGRLVMGRPGHVLEFGLGNGRTFDHLRGLFPDREIYCFDRQIAAHPDCVPDASHMFLGEFAETVPAARRRLGANAVLAHVDVGSGDREASLALGAWLAGEIAPLLVPGAIVVSDQPMPGEHWNTLHLPRGVGPGRYHMQSA